MGPESIYFFRIMLVWAKFRAVRRIFWWGRKYCAKSLLATIICAAGGGAEVLGAFNTGIIMGRRLQTVYLRLEA